MATTSSEDRAGVPPTQPLSRVADKGDLTHPTTSDGQGGAALRGAPPAGNHASGDQPGISSSTKEVRVLVCVSGSVAAVKLGELLTKLQGAAFCTKLAASRTGGIFLEHSQQALPKGTEILGDALDNEQDEEPLHIKLTQWADVLLLAPLSANTLAKVSMGLCDNLVTRVARCWPVKSKSFLVAPAMNTKMWEHPATSRQLQSLKDLGAAVLPPISKRLACGDVGTGAMANVDDIVAAVAEKVGVLLLRAAKPSTGKP